MAATNHKTTRVAKVAYFRNKKIFYTKKIEKIVRKLEISNFLFLRFRHFLKFPRFNCCKVIVWMSTFYSKSQNYKKKYFSRPKSKNRKNRRIYEKNAYIPQKNVFFRKWPRYSWSVIKMDSEKFGRISRTRGALKFVSYECFNHVYVFNYDVSPKKWPSPSHKHSVIYFKTSIIWQI